MKEFKLPDGSLLAYRDEGAGAPLVLIHGWAMSSAVFTEAIDSFKTDHRVLAPDLPGHGASSEPDAYSLQSMAESLAQWMRELDLQQVTLLGWSLGGQVTLNLYSLLKERIRQLILVGTTPRFTQGDDWEHALPATQVRAMGRNLKRNYVRTMGDFFNLQFSAEEMSRERLLEISRFVVREGKMPSEDAAQKALNILAVEDLRKNVSEVTCPALVVHGELDQIIPVRAGQWLAQNLPDAHIVRLPNVGHAPFLSNPEDVFKAWRTVLS